MSENRAAKAGMAKDAQRKVNRILIFYFLLFETF